MQFKKYTSINRSKKTTGNLSTFSRYVLEKGWGDTLCIMEEKVHGTNFQISFNGKKFVYGKRSSTLTVKDNFFGNYYFDLVEPLKNKIEQIFDTLVERYPGLKQITLHAELAGGIRNGEIPQMVVQRGVNYNAEQFLYFFNIRMFTEEVSSETTGTETEETELFQWILNPLESKWFFAEHDMLHAKVLGTGRLIDLLRNPKWGDSEVTKELNPGEDPNCILEGYVIKSVERNRQYTGNDRLVLKLINPAYEETVKFANNPNKTVKSHRDMPLELLDLIGKATAYMTEMRLDKVCGNLGISESNFEGKMFGQVLNALLDDVVADMKTDELEIPEKWEALLRSRLNGKAAPIIREKFFGYKATTETRLAA